MVAKSPPPPARYLPQVIRPEPIVHPWSGYSNGPVVVESRFELLTLGRPHCQVSTTVNKTKTNCTSVVLHQGADQLYINVKVLI